MKSQGLGSLGNDVGMAALCCALGSDCSVIAACPVYWGQYLNQFGQAVPPFLARFREETLVGAPGVATAAADASASPDITPQMIGELVLSTVEEVMNVANVGTEVPLMDAGMDSLSAVEFRTRLSGQLPGVKLPNTLVFDYPTVSSIVRFAFSQLAPVAGATSTALQRGAGSHVQVQIQGLASSFPGGQDGSYWDNVASRKDSVVEVPYTRFDVDTYYDSDPDAPGKTYARHGGFVEGAELFDASAFTLSPAEANAMDPQQRMILEVVQRAFAFAGMEKVSMMGTDIGIFVGQCSHDWQGIVNAGSPFSTYSGTGVSASIVANRISYLFGVKGPSSVCDTACSSSLVAADAALSSVHKGTSDAALIGGTQLILAVASYIMFSRARMLSETGRCMTFDESANGYCRAAVPSAGGL
jgi:acyl carrier protein